MAIKRIMRHLKGTEDYGLWYKMGGNLNLKVFIDANWASNIDDRKRTSGGAFFLGKRLVSWTRKKQNCISQPIVEVEYVAVVVNCSNIIWFRKLLTSMKSKSDILKTSVPSTSYSSIQCAISSFDVLV